MNNQIENYWKIYLMINDWIKFADVKAGILLTIYGLISTIVYTNANSVYLNLQVSSFRIIICVGICLSSIVSITYTFLCINPRLNKPNIKSIIFFGDIANKFDSFENYYDESVRIVKDDPKLIKQITEQIYTNSLIASKKFHNIKIAVQFFSISIFLLIFLIFVYFTT